MTDGAIEQRPVTQAEAGELLARFAAPEVGVDCLVGRAMFPALLTMLVGAWVATLRGAPIATAWGLGLLAGVSLGALLVGSRINSQRRARRRFESVRDRLRDETVRVYRFEVRRYWYVDRHPDEYYEFGFTVLLETAADPVPDYVLVFVDSESARKGVSPPSSRFVTLHVLEPFGVVLSLTSTGEPMEAVGGLTDAGWRGLTYSADVQREFVLLRRETLPKQSKTAVCDEE